MIAINIKPILPSTVNSINQAKGSKSDSSFSKVLNNTLRANDPFDQLFIAAGEKYNISPNLLKAMAKIESNFNPNAVSKSGAQGIMQLMPATAREVGVKNPFDAAENIFGGAKYLRKLLDKFQGNVELALAAYNAGPGNVEKFNGIPPFKETLAYVPKVLEYAYSYNLQTAPDQSHPVVAPVQNQHQEPSSVLASSKDAHTFLAEMLIINMMVEILNKS